MQCEWPAVEGSTGDYMWNEVLQMPQSQRKPPALRSLCGERTARLHVVN